jgi:predicted O-methyltransferase YrrM
MRDEKERRQGLPGSQRIQALHPDSAKFLYLTAMGLKAKNIVEIGTNRGYSTIWLALVAEKYGGNVITCEIDPARAEEAQGYFEKAGLSQYIKILVGDARQTLRNQTGPVDLLFIDAAKAQYETYFDIVYKRLGMGNMIIADNAISHDDELLDYITYVQNHPNLESITVPIGRGLEMSVKTSA